VDARPQGESLVEFALMIGLISIVAIVALLFFGSQISAILDTIAEAL
jgi:Flp pilus assembly pilin Flp